MKFKVWCQIWLPGTKRVKPIEFRRGPTKLSWFTEWTGWRTWNQIAAILYSTRGIRNCMFFPAKSQQLACCGFTRKQMIFWTDKLDLMIEIRNYSSLFICVGFNKLMAPSPWQWIANQSIRSCIHCDLFSIKLANSYMDPRWTTLFLWSSIRFLRKPFFPINSVSTFYGLPLFFFFKL